MGSLILLFLIIIGFSFCIIFKLIDKRVLFEGLVIGTISGIFISFATDVNYRASIYGSLIVLGRKVDKNLKYASKNWGSINATQISDGVVNVSATNIATGSVVTFTNAPLSMLPSDLRYAVATGDVATNRTIINILAPEVYSPHVAGGSIIELKKDEQKN